MDISTRILSDITVYMKYAKYRPELKRRETWKELVKRNMDIIIKKMDEGGLGIVVFDTEKRISYYFFP